MQPVATESADRLTIKPAVTIGGNPILETFPEEAQRRRFPNSMRRNPLAYLIKIVSESKDNSPSQRLYVEFDRSRNANCSIELYHSIVDHASLQSSNESQIPKPLKLSDSLVRSLQILKHNNTSLKNFRSQFVSNRDRTRKMINGNNPDRTLKKSNTSNSNATIMNLLPSFKKDRYVTEKNISKSKNSNMRNISSKEEYQNGDVRNINETKTRLERNMSNRNDIDINKANVTYFFNNDTWKAKKIYEEISTESNILVNQIESTDAVIAQIDNLICKFIADKFRVCHPNDSATMKISIKPIYMTTSKTTVTNDANINRNSSVTDVRDKNKILENKPRRRYGWAYQKYYDKYLRKLITSSSTTTMKTSTKSAINAWTSTILKNTSLKNVDEYEVIKTLKTEERNMTRAATRSIDSDILFNKTHERQNLRKNYVKTKNNNLDSREDFFGYKIARKDGKVSNYYNKYLKHVTPSKRTVSAMNKIEEYTIANMEHDRTEKTVLPVLRGISTTEKTNRDEYSSIKTKKLYEFNSPKVEKHPSNVVNDVNIMSNFSISNPNATQQNRGKKYSKTNKQSNAFFEKFYGDNENSVQNGKIDSGLISSNETPESITADDCKYKESQESRETLEEGSKNDFDVLILSSTTTRAPEIVTRDANESRQKASTDRHGKRKHKGRHNSRKNNRPKKGKKNHGAKRKRKPTSTVAWEVSEPTSDYGNAYSSERAKTTFSHNASGYDKADGNRNTSSGRNDWYLTDEITTKSFKTEFSNADESVSEHLTEDSIHDGFQPEETTNVDLVTNSTIPHLSTAKKGSKKCKVLITTTTESNWFGGWWSNNNKKMDEELTECEDVTSFPITSDSIEEETGYRSTSVSDDSSTYDVISKSVTTLSWKFSNKKNKKISDEEIRTAYSTDEENNNKRNTTSNSILDEESDESDEGTRKFWDHESTTHSMGGTTHDVNSDLDSEEEEDATEKSLSDEDNEIDNGVVAITEDYESDNCNENQHACDKYTCIEEDRVCDGIVDCLNANDETDCDYIYVKRWEEHERANKRVGGSMSSLNSVENTLDGCSRYEHPCDGTCINALNVCDGKRDCLDGTDEENCTEGIPYIENNILRELASRFALRPRCKKFLASNGTRTSRKSSSRRNVISGATCHLRCTENGFENIKSANMWMSSWETADIYPGGKLRNIIFGYTHRYFVLYV